MRSRPRAQTLTGAIATDRQIRPIATRTNEYNPQRTKASLQSFTLPAAADLASLTAQVAVNDHFAYTLSASDAAVMDAVRQGIKHVIFIIRENRTYDQILGDLGQGDGDPTLTEFGVKITPNVHALAKQFVTLDRFMDTAEVSYDGWSWSTAARPPILLNTSTPPSTRPRPEWGSQRRQSQRERDPLKRSARTRRAYTTAGRRSLHIQRSRCFARPGRRGCAGWTQQ